MRFSVHRHLLLLYFAISTITAACSVYDEELPKTRPEAGTPGAGGTNAGTGGGAGDGGSGGASGSSGKADDASGDAALDDANAVRADATPPAADAADAALLDRAADASEAGSSGDGAAADTLPTEDGDPLDVTDAAIADANDAGPTSDGSNDAPPMLDADAMVVADADSGGRDGSDGGPMGPQILPMHGTPIEKPDASVPFDSRCATDEVVTGFVGRAGVQTDAIASTCSKLIGGVLSSPRNLALNGNMTGGNPFTVTCPANHVAVSIVGRYGHNTMWMEDVTTAIGVVCKNLGSTATQTVTITGQPALDAGYTTFREDCTAGLYLTSITGRTDSNSLGYTVQQVGGECNVR
jgi:hypothetical protein